MLAVLVTLILAAAADARPVSLAAVGDIMLAGSSAKLLQRTGYDYPFAALAGRLRGCDVAVGNLEAPIATSGREFTGKRFRFRTDARAAAAMQRAGFGVLTLANNHMMDFGSDGLLSTLGHLNNQGIRYAGAGADLSSARQATVVTVDGVRIAFLAYSLTYPAEFYATGQRAGTAPGLRRYVAEDVARARRGAEYVVVSFHWGGEGESLPRSYQVAAAHHAIDAGADVVLGHHPHVLQGVERYGRGVILYSLGNFAFGSMSRKAGESVLARIVFDGGVREVELVPLNVLNRQVRFQPREINGIPADSLIERMNRLSAGMRSRMVKLDGRYLLQMP
jgi:poly-gamma-glutamate synthesis protein (capsule biosynthesis protein)